MAISAAQVVVSSTPAALNPPDTDTVAGGTLVVRNSHASDAVALGGSGVTVETGFQLAAGATVTVHLGSGDRLYGIRGAAADVTVHVLRIGA